MGSFSHRRSRSVTTPSLQPPGETPSILPLASALLGRPLNVQFDQEVTAQAEATALLDRCATTIMLVALELPSLLGVAPLEGETVTITLQVAGEQ